jgi:hypothetical protein
VTVVAKPLWLLRIRRETPRYLVCACAATGLLASLRYAIAPPRATPATTSSGPPAADHAASAFAVLFARRYLTWTATQPQASRQALAVYAGPGIEAGAGFTPPAGGEQRVLWAETVQERSPAPREHIYTVAAQTDSAGLLYLGVAVARDGEGNLFLSRYPAFVGPPASVPSPPPVRSPEVTDPTLATVVRRALRNYLAGSADELQADLTGGARVALPPTPLELDSLEHLAWSQDGRSAVAVVQASDMRGAAYTLTYELDVSHAQGRWEVAALQMEPNE